MTTVTNATTNDQPDKAAMPVGKEQFELLGEQPAADDAEATDAVQAASGPTGEQVMNLLEEHVPLSLIMDLSVPAGPDSQDILCTEGKPDASWWLAH